MSDSDKRDIVVTWPVKRPLSSYLLELERARDADLVINYRVRHPPRPTPERCYISHENKVVGWSPVRDVVWREDDEVARVESDAFAGFWPAGWYVVRAPLFQELPKSRQIRIDGFRGWRWFNRNAVGGL